MIVLLAPSDAHARSHGAPVRPRAVVRVEITSRLYRTRLDADATRCGVVCRSLETQLTSAARTLFDARYRFVDWRAAGEPTPDTVVLRIREKPSGGHVEIVVALLGKARAVSSDSVVAFFDDFFEAQQRDRSYWLAAGLPHTVADMIAARLDANAARIIPVVIGRLPLAAAVNLPVADSSSRVDVSADSLRAATSPPVSFLVRVGIEERVQGTVVERQGELKLIDCAEGSGNGQKRYVCRRIEFSVTSPTREVADFSGRERVPGAAVGANLQAIARVVARRQRARAAGQVECEVRWARHRRYESEIAWRRRTAPARRVLAERERTDADRQCDRELSRERHPVDAGPSGFDARHAS